MERGTKHKRNLGVYFILMSNERVNQGIDHGLITGESKL